MKDIKKLTKLNSQTMKKILLILVSVIALISFNACDEEDSPTFIAKPTEKGISFINSFASEYLLSEETKNNIADRFIWEEADFDAPTNVTYELLGSIDPAFETFAVIGSTSETNLAVTVDQLLDFADDLELDNDPTTTTDDGLANNTGQVYFRVKAYVGSGASNTIEALSEVQIVTIVVIEKAVETDTCPSIYAVGDALADIGWNFLPSSEIVCSNDIHTAKFSFTNGNFRFFEESDNWSSSLNYPYFIDEGYTIDANLASAEDGDGNFTFVGTPGIYTLTIDAVNKEIVLTPSSSLWAVGGAVPGGWNFTEGETVEFVEVSPDIWQASITLSNDIFRFFQIFGTWDTNNNYTHYEEAGFTIDSNFESDGGDDANFKFTGTPGTYVLTINALEKIITLE